jgi:hypothetical protein
MSATAHAAPDRFAESFTGFSKSRIWTGRIISTLVVLFLALDAITKLIREPHVMEATKQMGLAPATVVTVGAILSVCLAIHLVPRLAVVGAVLLTGYLGGAAATNMVVGHPFFECMFPVIFGALVWLGLYLRDARVQALWART